VAIEGSLKYANDANVDMSDDTELGPDFTDAGVMPPLELEYSLDLKESPCLPDIYPLVKLSFEVGDIVTCFLLRVLDCLPSLRTPLGTLLSDVP
jgi:hypothetical protein